MKSMWLSLCLMLSTSVMALELRDVINTVDDVSIEVLQDGSEILASSEGLTLYTFDNDTAGVSTCFDRCLRVWPAAVTVLDSLPTPFSVHVRPDGVKQIVLNGQPLYFFQSDEAPGDIFGDGIGGVWHIIKL